MAEFDFSDDFSGAHEAKYDDFADQPDPLEGVKTSRHIVLKTNDDQPYPFITKRDGSTWTLSINRLRLHSQGFLPSDIEGAIAIEHERLSSVISVDTQSDLKAHREWWDVSRDNPHAIAFKTLFERLSALKRLEKNDPPMAEKAMKYLKKQSLRISTGTYADELYRAVFRTVIDPTREEELTQITSAMLNDLSKVEIIDGRAVSTINALSSDTLSPEAKKKWFERRFLPRLEALQKQDEIREQQPPQEQEQQQDGGENGESDEQDDSEQQLQPPPDTKDEREQHRGKETEGNKQNEPTFIIDPYYPGYWETDSYSIIDETTGRIIKSPQERVRTPLAKITSPYGETVTTLRGITGTNLFNLPLTFKMTIDNESLAELKKKGISVFIDPEGHIFLQSIKSQQFEVSLARTFAPDRSPDLPTDTIMVERNLPLEMVTEINRIRSAQVDSIEKANMWKEYIQEHYKYASSEHVEAVYHAVDSHPGARLSALSTQTRLDCHLARELFLGGIKRLGLNDLEWRASDGHYVDGRHKRSGTGHMSPGTFHAWVRARIKGQSDWLVFDPTPPGDPNQSGQGATDQQRPPKDSSQKSKEQQESGDESGDQKKPADSQPGTDEKLVSDKDAKDLSDEIGVTDINQRKKHETTPQERYILNFAKEAGVTIREARKIIETLKQVDELTNAKGEKILLKVQREFMKIIQQITTRTIEYYGSVEMDRGIDLTEPIDTYLDILAGDMAPRGFSRRYVNELVHEMYGGFDLEVIADGSSSMNEPLGGVVKYVAQQQMLYLLHKAAHLFAEETQKRHADLATPLGIRSSQYKFRGGSWGDGDSGEVDVIKELSASFNPIEQGLLWRNTGLNINGGTPAHLGLMAVYDRIPENEKELLRQKKLLKLVILISDGEYTGPPNRVPEEIQRLRDLNVVVAEFRITDERSLQEMPDMLANKVIETARLLMPEKIRQKIRESERS